MGGQYLYWKTWPTDDIKVEHNRTLIYHTMCDILRCDSHIALLLGSRLVSVLTRVLSFFTIFFTAMLPTPAKER